MLASLLTQILVVFNHFHHPTLELIKQEIFFFIFCFDLFMDDFFSIFLNILEFIVFGDYWALFLWLLVFSVLIYGYGWAIESIYKKKKNSSMHRRPMWYSFFKMKWWDEKNGFQDWYLGAEMIIKHKHSTSKISKITNCYILNINYPTIANWYLGKEIF